jgi:uncharacterized protein with von Willebrand factor type A (vWA) domain
MARRLTYSRWDGTQVGFDLDADEVMAQLNDHLLYNGDVNSALRNMLQKGMRDRNGRDVAGVQELMRKLQERRRQALENHDLGGVYDEVARELDDLVEAERSAIDDIVQQAHNSGDERRSETADAMAADKNMRLDFLPPDLAGKVRELSNYEFASAEAQQRFEDLMNKLREQLMQNHLNKLTQNVNNMTPEDMARMKDMFSALNQMIEQRNAEQPIDPSFEQFMENFGDFFPGDPQTLDELLEQIAQQMAAAQAMLNSMTPEQRAQMQALSDQLLEDMDLRWQMDQLGQNLRQAFPGMGWEKGYDFQGSNPVGMGERARQHRSAGKPAEERVAARGARRSRYRRRPPIARRRRCACAREAGRSRQDAGTRRADRAEGRSVRTHAERHATGRRECAR